MAVLHPYLFSDPEFHLANCSRLCAKLSINTMNVLSFFANICKATEHLMLKGRTLGYNHVHLFQSCDLR